MMEVVMINDRALDRVMNGQAGMTFVVDMFTYNIGDGGRTAHVRDYRYNNSNAVNGKLYQIWSIGPEGYEVIS